MFRPVIRALRSVASGPPLVTSAVRHCSHISFVPRLNPAASLPPPLWQTVDQFILPTRSSPSNSAIMDKLPAEPLFAPEISRLTVTYTLPPSSKSSAMYAGLRVLRIYRPYKPKNMLRIRREKMNKHRLRKFRKKYAALIKKVKMKREVKKEKLFRAELLAQIKEAEQFDAEIYVRKMLDTIDKKPQQESLWERRERFLQLRRKYRSDVDLLPPKFDDPVN